MTERTVRSSDHELDRFAASRDLWPGGTLDAWQGRGAPMPARVFWPEDEEQVLRVLRDAEAAGVAVVPYGAGSGVCGGARGREGAWVIDTKGLDGIGPLDTERWTVDVDAGVNGQHLEDWLEARGFTLGHSPSSIACSTVGGWAAARGAGQFSSLYGVFEDMVLGVRGVAPGEGAFGVGELGDGPADWMDQLLGSEGTLAVLTRFRLRVWPTPSARWLRGYRFDSVAAALHAMRRLMAEELWPSVVRLYDPVDTRIGGKTRPKKERSSDGFVRRWLREADRLPGLRRRSLALPLALPGLVNRLLDGVAAGCLLVVGFEGRPDLVDAAVGPARSLLEAAGGEDLGAEPGERWFHSRHAVSFKLMPVFERGGFADTMEVAARWSVLPGLYQAVRAAVRPYGVIMAHMSHVYPEGGCIYFSFAGKGDRATYDALWRAALHAALDAGGTVTHHHGVGELKADAATAELGPAVAAYRALQQRLDPRRVLNPGRLLTDRPPVDAGAAPTLSLDDGLARSAVTADLATRQALARPGEVMWPFEALPAPPRWQRPRHQQPWVEVHAAVSGIRSTLGRGPRSAAGPDLRAWLAEQPAATATWAVAPAGPRWMGVGRPDRPWAVARRLLRHGLRPAVLGVVDGELRVGFRGVAASAFGAIAAGLVPGGLASTSYAPLPLPAGALLPCEDDDPGVVSVTAHGAFRRAT